MLSRVLNGCVIEALDGPGARVVGQLLARSNTTDVVDASVVAGARRRGDAVFTNDQRDIETLASASANASTSLPCS